MEKRLIMYNLAYASVPDPKLIIWDPDSQMENRVFRIRIRILDVIWILL